MNENTFLSVFEGVPVFDVKKEVIDKGVSISDLCAEHTQVFASKGELRRLVQGGGLSINKEKIENAEIITRSGCSPEQQIPAYSEREEKLFPYKGYLRITLEDRQQ